MLRVFVCVALSYGSSLENFGLCMFAARYTLPQLLFVSLAFITVHLPARSRVVVLCAVFAREISVFVVVGG